MQQENKPIVFGRVRSSFLALPIRFQLIIAIIFLLWLTILALSLLVLHRQKDQLYEKSLQLGEISLNYFAGSALLPLANDDILTLNKMITNVVEVEDLVYAIVVNKDNVVRAHTDPAKIDAPIEVFTHVEDTHLEGDLTYFNHTLPDGSYVLNMSRPVRFKDKLLGRIHVGISLEFIAHTIRRETLTILILSAHIIGLGIAIAALLGIGFSRPINLLVKATHELGQGNYDHRLQMDRKDEFGHLAESFNFMAEELKNKDLIETSFGRYVSPEVVEMLLSNPSESWLKGTTGVATILFTDIRGFTAYAEKTDPEKVVANLNEYFAIATNAILKHGGRIDKFIGDAVLGVFGLPLPQKDHALRAVMAALDMQQQFNTVAAQGNPLLGKVGVGIDTDRVVAGTLGSKVKMEYTVIGDGVNVASRINSLAGSGEIIISNFCYREINSKVQVEALEPQTFKGKSSPIEVFRVVGLTVNSSGQVS